MADKRLLIETKTPEVIVKNIWCPNCSGQKFKLQYALHCTNCGTCVEWSKTWKEWYGSSSPGKNFATELPSGTKWEQSATGWYVMIPQYNPNTGKRLADPKVRKALLKLRSCLEKKLARISHQLELAK